MQCASRSQSAQGGTTGEGNSINDKTLADRIRKGLDERTHELEALACLRIAGKQFDGASRAPDADRLGKLKEERDAARAEAKEAKAETDRVKVILGKLLALKEAEEKLERNRADVVREARAIVHPPKAQPARPVSVQDYVTGYANRDGTVWDPFNGKW